MTELSLRVMERMISLYAGDARESNTLPVFAYCSLIGQRRGCRRRAANA